MEIEFADDPAFADQPYQPTPYNKNPVRTAPGWYSGDIHVHAEHSAYGNATMIDSFNYAFTPVSRAAAGSTSSRSPTTSRAAPGARSASSSRGTRTT